MDLARIASGQALPPRRRRSVTRSDIVKYQGASGDFDAAHHDDDHARSFGFPGVFSLGMLHAGELSVYATDNFGAESLRSFKVRFKGIVNLGDELTYSGTVRAVRETVDGRMAELDLVATIAGERVVLLASATFLLRS
jgi:acyl dehydratase